MWLVRGMNMLPESSRLGYTKMKHLLIHVVCSASGCTRQKGQSGDAFIVLKTSPFPKPITAIIVVLCGAVLYTTIVAICSAIRHTTLGVL